MVWDSISINPETKLEIKKIKELTEKKTGKKTTYDDIVKQAIELFQKKIIGGKSNGELS